MYKRQFEAFVKPEAVQLFLKYNIYSEAEISSRYQIKIDKYIKRVNAEILVFLDMINNQIIPSYLRYADFLANSIQRKKKLGKEMCIRDSALALTSISPVAA